MKRPDTADELGPFERAVIEYTSTKPRLVKRDWQLARGTNPRGLVVPDVFEREPERPDEGALAVAGALAAVTLENPLLRQLDSNRLVDLARAGELVSCGAGQLLFAHGDTADAVYIVARGSVDVHHGASRQPTARSLRRAGDLIGETAALADAPRASTATALEPTTVVRIPVAAARRILLAAYRTAELFVRSLVHQLALPGAPSLVFFEHAAPSALASLIDRFEWVEVSPGDTVVTAGRRSEGFCLVLAGVLDVIDERRGGDIVARLGEGSVFGAASLLDGSLATTTIRSATDAWLLRLPPTEFEATVERYPMLLEELAVLVEARRLELATRVQPPDATTPPTLVLEA